MKRIALRSPLAAVLALCIVCAGCSREPTNSWQGYVEGEFLYLASSQAGQLTELSVSRGQTVANDTPLFALEARNETEAVAQANQQLQAARAQLADLTTGKRPPEVDVTRAQLVQAEADAARAATQYRRDEQQLRVGGIAQSQLDESRANALSSAARVRELQSQVVVAHLPGRSEQIRAQRAQVDAALAQLGQAQWKLDQKSVRAPHGGLVFDTMYRSGEWVPAGSPVIRLLPPENVKVRFFVPEAVVGSLAPGRRVTIRCDGCAADVPAVLSFISNEAEYTPPVIFSNESRSKLVFMVEAKPQTADAPKLRPGQPVTVTLQ
ncbi:HlyD family efflux transporter periplasmic adaptor subunit [Paraburkholderia sp. MMS20-SJTR3]|uniref:HlyD family efflux transporter periplasmic adaptor subunit n=1 Tax=Paraburkholderia sejongensis TaxID=2886946 RepID=A0ABS8K1K3_9BURK|nr:HlyD family efflux transporter periplasmic adaptor subunit [Paraburkholderia sp. MMS20-SJTR3]MCC8395895.1 HlyD family efflux transporter periplasmic adaptor subunit [Paraburkholderia sp. MMS20-SJTR3]